MRILPLLFTILKASISLAQTDSIQTIKCDADTAQSYSLLLPNGYQKQQKYPVIFLFDPDARGKMVAGFYGRAATQYGFILIASNNSRNGPMNESLNAASAMFTDAFKKYSIDDQQVYLGGFSGGARVATTIALQTPGITGVIACGAGFAEPIPQTKLTWTMAAIAGTRDFNYVELQQAVQELQPNGSIASLQTFSGPHRWPPAAVFMSALLWSYLKHQKQGADHQQEQYKSLIDTLIRQNKPATAKANFYRQYLLVRPDSVYAEKLKSLENTPAYRDELVREKQLMLKEGAYQQKIIEAFQAIFMADLSTIKSKGWWKGELAALNKILQSHNSSDSDYVARQKAFINGNAGESFGNYYSARRYDTAAELVIVSDIFDPENPGVFYLHALLSAAEKDESQTVYYLKEAVKRGLDQQRLRSAQFGFLQNNKQYQALLK